jgi:flagellar basal-body rod protein FlgC
MTLFGALPITQSGMETSQTWLDAISGNIANANDVVATDKPAYQEVYVDIAPEPANETPGQIPAGQGSTVAAVEYGSSAGILEYDPTNPLADANGDVRGTTVDLGDQLVDSVMAQTDFQANVSMNQRAEAAYKAALTIG